MATCENPECAASATRRGYCDRHYRSARRRGEVGWDGTPCLHADCDRAPISRGLCSMHYQQVLQTERGPCSIGGCEAEAFAKGWCKKHYSADRRHGDPLAWKRRPRNVCSVDDCDLNVAANGVCDKHYRRIKRYGTTELPPKPIAVPPPPFHCKQCGTEVPKRASGRHAFCVAACREAWQYWDRRENHRSRWLKKYGLTVEQYDLMLAEQGGGCAICGGTDPRGRAKSPHFQVDHCHETGRVRGLLCAPCNSALGGFQDDPDVLRAAIAYLMRVPAETA